MFTVNVELYHIYKAASDN